MWVLPQAAEGAGLAELWWCVRFTMWSTIHERYVKDGLQLSSAVSGRRNRLCMVLQVPAFPHTVSCFTDFKEQSTAWKAREICVL